LPQSFKEFIDKLRLTADVVEVVGGYVELRQTGANYKGLCPFHQEKTPSFIVSPGRQTFHCFGCEAGGDVIEFTKRIENLDFRDAVETLSRRYGLQPPQFGPKDGDEKAQKFREALLNINALAAELFSRLLKHVDRGRAAREYLDARGLDQQTRERFGIGLSPDGWDNFLRAGKTKGFSEEAMTAAGILYHNEEKRKVYDRFRNRIMFPIWDSTGRPIAFGGRVFGADAEDHGGAKYINSPETPIYKKGSCLYAYHLARDDIRAQGRAILCEGYTDVIALHQNGFTNAVASLGTALTPDQARLLRRLAKEAIFLYDDDEAGRNAMLRGTQILSAQEISVRCVGLKEGEDPDSFLRGQGREAFAARLENAKPFFDYFLALARGEHDFKSVEGRISATEYMGPLIKSVRRPIEAEDYIQRLAGALGMNVNVIRSQLRMGRQDAPARNAPDLKADAYGAPAAQLTHRAEVALLRILVDRPDLAAILTGFDLDWVENEQIRRWTSRIVDSAFESQAGLQNLLDLTEDESERAFLRRVALMDEKIRDPESTLQQAVARLEARSRKKRFHALRVTFSGPKTDEMNEEDRRKLAEIHQAARDRVAASRRIAPSNG
jgi:DNA primase